MEEVQDFEVGAKDKEVPKAAVSSKLASRRRRRPKPRCQCRSPRAMIG
jgi:hypothetical protein